MVVTLAGQFVLAIELEGNGWVHVFVFFMLFSVFWNGYNWVGKFGASVWERG